MKKLFAVLLALSAAATVRPAAAQLIPNFTPFSFEVRGGAALPRGDFGDLADAGTTFGGSATFHFFPLLGVYGGYTQTSFGGDGDWSESGFDAGVRASVPTLVLPFSPWAKAGLVFYQLDAEGESFDRSLGYELGAGVAWSVFPKITLTPGVSWVSYTAETNRTESGDVDVSHLKVDVGIRLRL